MSLEELKKRATAAEFTLIEATEKALRAKITNELRQSVITFCNENPPPSPEFSRFERDAPTKWVAKLHFHLNPEEP